MREIPLTQGQVALIDDEDYELVSQYKWYAQRGRGTYYARSWLPRSGGGQIPLRMHGLIMGKGPNGETPDHADRNGLNNQRNNLRFATHAEQRRNADRARNNTSGFKGVTRHNGAWRARITVDKTQIVLGHFEAAEDAARAYDTRAKEFFGEFARLNFE